MAVDATATSAETPSRRALQWAGPDLKVRFYGKLADQFGSQREIAVGTPCTVADLRDRLSAEFPQAADALRDRRVRAFIGNELAGNTDVVIDGEVLEFLAPVSGG